LGSLTSSSLSSWMRRWSDSALMRRWTTCADLGVPRATTTAAMSPGSPSTVRTLKLSAFVASWQRNVARSTMGSFAVSWRGSTGLRLTMDVFSAVSKSSTRTDDLTDTRSTGTGSSMVTT